MKKTTCEYVLYGCTYGNEYENAPIVINKTIAKYENAGWEFVQAVQLTGHYGVLLFFSKEVRNANQPI